MNLTLTSKLILFCCTSMYKFNYAAKNIYFRVNRMQKSIFGFEKTVSLTIKITHNISENQCQQNKLLFQKFFFNSRKYIGF